MTADGDGAERQLELLLKESESNLRGRAKSEWTAFKKPISEYADDIRSFDGKTEEERRLARGFYGESLGTRTSLTSFDRKALKKIVTNLLNGFRPVSDTTSSQFQSSAPTSTTETPNMQFIPYAVPSERFQLVDDISYGHYFSPIPVYSDVYEDLSLPESFNWITTSKSNLSAEQEGPRFYKDEHDEFGTFACRCVNECYESCPCVLRNRIDPSKAPFFRGGKSDSYHKPARIRAQGLNTWIGYECGPDCGCAGSCSNKVVIDPTLRFEVVRLNTRTGFCLRTLSNIQRGHTVVEFAGMIQSEEGIHATHEEDYAYELPKYTVDDSREGVLHTNPLHAGNHARFVNSSELPNTEIVAVRRQGEPMNAPRIYLVAVSPILAGSEITFFYGKRFHARMPRCLCFSPVCSSSELIQMLRDLGDDADAREHWGKELLQMLTQRELEIRKRMRMHELAMRVELFADYPASERDWKKPLFREGQFDRSVDSDGDSDLEEWERFMYDGQAIEDYDEEEGRTRERKYQLREQQLREAEKRSQDPMETNSLT